MNYQQFVLVIKSDRDGSWTCVVYMWGVRGLHEIIL